MEAYLLKSGIALICFYFIYRILVRHNQLFNLNRIIIISSVLIASFIPIISINMIGLSNNQVIQNLEPIIISNMENPSFFHAMKTSYSIFSIVYIIGLFVFSIRSVTGLATLSYMYWRYPKKNYHGFKSVIIKGNQSPFTFFNILFISKADYNKSRINELLVHEKVHQDHFHSIDLIFMEFMTAVQWFNPAIWLFKYDLKSEHEFLADEQVIKKGFSKTRYQSLLLQFHEGIALYLGNNFNYSILKKRLIMITKQKSNHLLKTNYVIAVPALLVATMLLFFNFQLGGQISTTPDVMPEYKEGESALYSKIQKAIKYPLEARNKNMQGQVFVSFTVTKNGSVKKIKADDSKYNLLKETVVVAYNNEKTPEEISDDLTVLQKEGERLVALLGEFIPGQKNGKSIDTRITIPITFKLIN